MKKVVLITAHFPPSNLVGVHRARVWSHYLPEFGWEPIVLTTHWDYYEEKLDWGLTRLVAQNLQVIRTKALRTEPVRLLGNMALRAMWWTRRALDGLLAEQKIDFVHIVLPDHFSALLGPRIFTKHRVPYGIDYGDPWVSDSPRSKRLLSKAWTSCCLSYICEPWALRHARLVTGVSTLSYRDVFRRNPSLKEQAVTATIPLASSKRDFELIPEDYEPSARLFDPSDGRFHLIYAGALWPKAKPVVERFLRSVSSLIQEEGWEDRLRITFVGTGRTPDDPNAHSVRDLIERFALSKCVHEHPVRVAYLDVLWHLKAASCVLVLGSTDAHYMPSKVFQAIQSNNPVFALLHKDSPATSLLKRANAGVVVGIPDDGLLDVESTKRKLKELIESPSGRFSVRHDVLESYSARQTTKRFAEAMESACLS